MEIIGTAIVQNELANSHYGFELTKPIHQYAFKVLEEAEHDGSLLCVVYDLDQKEAIGIADVAERDVAKFIRNPDVDPATDFMSLIMSLASKVRKCEDAP